MKSTGINNAFFNTDRLQLFEQSLRPRVLSVHEGSVRSGGSAGPQQCQRDAHLYAEHRENLSEAAG